MLRWLRTKRGINGHGCVTSPPHRKAIGLNAATYHRAPFACAGCSRGALRTHAATLRRILRTLVAAGVLAKDGKDRSRLTVLGQPLRSDVGDSVRAATILLTGESELEGRLLDCVRTGKTAIELVAGVTNWIEYYQRDPGSAAAFNAAMTALSNAHYAGVVHSYDFRPVRKLVDVGGGARPAAVDDPDGLPQTTWRAVRAAARYRRREANP
jgi:hypothetical protein